MTSLYEEYPPESLLRQYPYGTMIGCGTIALFHGEDYTHPTFGGVPTTWVQPGERLNAGDSRRDPGNQGELRMQPDGNLVWYRLRDNHPLWATGTQNSGARWATMQTDGNLVVYDGANHPKWAAGTAGNPGANLAIQNDGNLVIYQGARVLWASNTQGFTDVHHPGSFFDDVGHFVSNTVSTAGREIGHVSHAIQNAAGQVGRGISHVPIVGGPMQSMFDAAYHTAMGPITMVTAIVLEGKRIDKALLHTLNESLHDFKQVAPYAQMVISVIPGIGQGVSAALSVGLALAEGQPISEVLKAGLIGLLPGGPLVKAAVTMGVETIQHVAKGERVDFATIAQTASGVASSALGLPLVAKNALIAGISTMGAIVKGQPLDKAMTDGAIAGLPIPQNTKQALLQTSTIALELAHGRRVDRVLISQMDTIASMLPPDHALHDSIKTGLSAIKNVAQGKRAEDVMSHALQSGLGDTLCSMGAKSLPPEVQKAIKSGISLGTGVVTQARRAEQLTKRIPGKLLESGIQLAKTSPLFGEARRIATKSQQGFDMAAGLLQQQAKVFDIATVRNTLDPMQKRGFDIACCLRIGAVSHPKPLRLSAAAHAGHAITMGMQSYSPARKQVIMHAVQAVPSAAVGATLAVREVAALRESWLKRLLRTLGLA